jgi:SAM-dependent methyltransferase
MFRLLAQHLLTHLRYLKNSIGQKSCECSVCGHKGRFLAYGSPPRYNALCWGCGCLERERLIVLADKSKSIFSGKRILHFAPEPSLSNYIKNLKIEKYVTADLFKKDVDIKQDIENLTLVDNSFDVVICSHVLEHVDDKKALAQMHKILVSGGVALLLTPIIEGWAQTYENSDVKSDRDREIYFGQNDHVRYFGYDFRDRIRGAGFNLEEFTAVEPFVSQFALLRGEKVFLARKI